MTHRTYVLVPGAGGAAWYWHRVVPLLQERGLGAVAVDLPAADDAAGLSEYADAIVEAGRGHDEVVLVAQSMGGLSAPLACERLDATALILVNALIPQPGETGADWWKVTGQAAAQREAELAAGRDPEAVLDPAVSLLHDVPAEVSATAPAGEQPQSGTSFEQPWPLAAWPDVPTRVISSREDRLFPVDFQARVAEERLGITPETVPGGHLVALSRPCELVSLLLAR